MKRSALLFLFLFLCCCAQASPLYDSAAAGKFIRQGAKRLQAVFDANDCRRGNGEALQLVLNLDAPVDNDYVSDLQASTYPPFLGGSLETALNARLNSVYQEQGVECYLVLINALEVRISSQLDTTYTLSDFFGPNKFFAENSDVVRQQQLHDSIARALAQRVFPQGRKCLMKTVAAYRTIFYNDSAHTNFHSKLFRLSPAGAPELPYFKEIGDYMQSYDAVYNRFPTPGNDSIARVAVSAFEHAARFAKLKAGLLNIFDPDSLEDVLRQFPSSGDWAAFTVAERLHCFSVLLRESWVNSGEELLVVNLVKTTPENDVFALLQGLEKESTLNTRNDFTVQSEKNNHRCLVARLMEAVDDDVIGAEDDHYTVFCKAISDKMTRCPQALAAYVSDDPAQFQQRLVYWYNVNLILPDEVGVITYDNVTLTDNAGLEFDRKEVVDRINTSTLQASGGNPSINFSYENIFHEEHVRLRAFDIVVFQNLSSLHMLESAGAQQGEILLLPAIFIKYARDKQWNSGALKSVALTVDVITLATGPGMLWKAARAAEWGVAALEAAQIAASAGNITVNVMEITDPEVRQAVDGFNLLVGAVGFTRLTVTAGSRISLRHTADLVWTSGGKMARWTRVQAEQFVVLVEKCLERIKTSSYAWKDKLVRFYEYVRRQITLQNATVYKPGDLIAGKAIQQIRNGNNGKIAIIGRKMDGHVMTVADALKTEGRQIETFSEADQIQNLFSIENKTYTWTEIVEDFGNKNKQYLTNEKGWIVDSEIPKTLMYKANQIWANKLRDQGYTVFDMGYPPNISSPSLFYNMELGIVF